MREMEKKIGASKMREPKGIHSPNIMMLTTEADGIDKKTFNAIDCILTRDSRLILISNKETSNENEK